MFNLFLTTEATTSGAGMLASFLPLVLVLVVFYFMLIRPQNKKSKQEAAMRSNLQIGDEIVTFGGIIGIIVSIKDDTLVIETGNERSKIRILRKAVESCLTVHEEEASNYLKEIRHRYCAYKPSARNMLELRKFGRE